MNNFKKIALGTTVAAFAFVFSAFTSEIPVAVGDRFVQTGSDEWTKIDPTVYDELACINNSDNPCYYLQDMSDTNDHGPVLNSTQISNIPSLQPSDREGVYDGPIEP